MENAALLEAHYYLKDGAHSMDAFVRNRCESEFLATVSYVAQRLWAELQFEASVSAEGGFRDIWRVLVHKDNRTLWVPAFTAIFCAILDISVHIWSAPPKPNPELERQQLEINRLAIQHSKIENIRSELEVEKLQRELSAGTPTTIHPALPNATAKKSPASLVNEPPLVQPEQLLSPNPAG